MEKAYYTMVPDVILKRKDIKLFPKLVLAKIHSLVRNGECKATNKYLAHLLCTSEKQISRAVMALARRGYVRVGEDAGLNRVIIPEKMEIIESECSFYVTITQADLQLLPLPIGSIFMLKSIAYLESLPKHCFISTNKIAESLQLDPQTITRSLKNLVDMGLISRTRRGRNRILYVNREAVEKLMSDTENALPPDSSYIKRKRSGDLSNQNASSIYTLQKKAKAQKDNKKHIVIDKKAPFHKKDPKTTTHKVQKLSYDRTQKLSTIVNTDNKSFIKKMLSKDNISNAEHSSSSYYISSTGKKVALKGLKRSNPVSKKTNPASPVVASNTACSSANTSAAPKWGSKVRSQNYQASHGLLPQSKIDTGIKKEKTVSVIAFQLYNALLDLGITKHRNGTKAMDTTMHYIHAMLSAHAKNPFESMEIADADCRAIQKRKFTYDEIISVFHFYMSHCKTQGKTPIRSFSAFIRMPYIDGCTPWSPFLYYFLLMKRAENQTKDSVLSSEATRLQKEFKKVRIDSIDHAGLNKLAAKLEHYTDGYSITPAMRISHNNDMASVFADYVSEKLERNLTFKIGYIFGDKFMEQFVSDMRDQNIILQGSYDSIMQSLYGGI